MRWSLRLCMVTWIVSACLAAAAEPESIRLWPDKPPQEQDGIGAEADITKATDQKIAGKSVIRLGNVSTPELKIFSPDPAKRNGAAVLVCPGGGYHILAMDLEGTEICEWLNSLGVTAALLKYRVPKRNWGEKHSAAFQDAQRAMGILRSRAGELKVDPKRIGVIGFSAGGHLAAVLSNHTDERSYPAIDAADKHGSRPNFSLLIYPAYLTDKDKGDAPAQEMVISTNTPPTFMVMAQDDPVRVENVLGYSVALQRHKVPFELHVYPSGGHGYGLRPTGEPITRWSEAAAVWLRGLGFAN